MTLSSIIIDDEISGINILKVLIEKYVPDVTVAASSTDPFEGARLIEEYKPDIIFLDISMPTLNGFELLESLHYRDFKLIFTTAHEEYAIKAIKTKAHDYLLKPIDIEELKSCLFKIINDQEKLPQKSESGIIELSVKDGIIFIKPNDVIRLEASGSYTTLYLENKVKYVASKNLKEFESMLDPTLFYRCHQSHIVNLQKVVKMVSADGLFAQMSDGSMPEIGKKQKDIFREKLKSS
jgi:two-component system LytT family response regulator